MERRSPELAQARSRAYAYAVFPSLGQSSALLGGTWGLGEVFTQKKQLVGYAALLQLTLGVQLGGQTSSQVILFEDPTALALFKGEKPGLSLGAAATLLKAGAARARGPQGSMATYVSTRGGLWVGAALGAQWFFYLPAVVTRSKPLREVLQSLLFRRNGHRLQEQPA
jgi:lipid-binding SYLF domain-containing protein